MATSSGATPADPTLQATTDDNSRGGLFVRSNIANPVEGVDVSGVQINDSTITIDINGTMQTFTTNQATDSTLSFTVEGGGGPVVTGGAVVTGGSFDYANGNLILTRSQSQPDLTITGLQSPRTDSDINTLADARIAAASLVRTVNGMTPDNAGNVTITGSGNTFTDSNTVDFTVNSTTNEVTAQAMVRVGNGTSSTTTLSSADSIIVDPATDFQIVEVGTDTGVYVFQRIPVTPPPAPAQPPSFTAPPATSALSPSPEETITFMAPTGNTVTAVNQVVVNDPDGNAISGVTSDTTSITIPAGAANAPGDYDISAEVTTRNDASGETRMSTERPELVRYIPFFQSRSQISDVTASGVTASTMEWNGGFTAIAGTSTLYIAVLASELASTVIQADQNMFPVRVGHVGTLTVTLADSTTRTFNQFRLQGAAGQTINNFR